MAALVTMAAAKSHLRVTGDDQDDDLYRKLAQASDAILDRCNSTAYWRALTPAWTITTIPLAVQAAILLVLTHLYEHRGDELVDDAAIWMAVDALIGLHKDPVLQ